MSAAALVKDCFGLELSLGGISQEKLHGDSRLQQAVNKYIHHVNMWQEGLLQYLSASQQRCHLERAIEAWQVIRSCTDPSLDRGTGGPVLVLAAIESMMHGTANDSEIEEMRLSVRELLDRARESVHLFTDREYLLMLSVYEWARGDIHAALKHHTVLAHKYPSDLTNLFVTFNHYIVAYDMAALEDLISNTVMKLPYFNTWEYRYYVQAMMCFVREQRFDFISAEHLGNQALEAEMGGAVFGKSPAALSAAAKRIYPWTHHSLCHVYDSTGRNNEGIEFMNRHSAAWEKADFFEKSHNWWHLSALCLEADQEESVKNIFQKHLWFTERDAHTNVLSSIKDSDRSSFIEAWRNDPMVLVGAVGLLIRMDIKRSIDALALGHRFPATDDWLESKWTDVAAVVHDKWNQKALLSPYFVVHYAYALRRMSILTRERILLDIDQYIENTSIPGEFLPIWRDVAFPLATALCQYAEGAWDECYETTQKMIHSILEDPEKRDRLTWDQLHSKDMTELQRATCSIGGSHAQRYFLEVIFMETLFRTGHKDELKKLVDKRVRQYQGRPVHTTQKFLELLTERHGLPSKP